MCVECWRQLRTGEKRLLPQDAPLGTPRGWGCTLSADPASRWFNQLWSYRNSVFWVIRIAGQGPCLIWFQIMRCKLKRCTNACHWIHMEILSRECLLPRHPPFSPVWKPNTKQTKKNWNSDESIDCLVNREPKQMMLLFSLLFSLFASFSLHLSPPPLSSSTLSAFFHFSFLFHVMGIFPAYLPVRRVQALYLWRPEEGIEPRVTDCCEPWCL